MNISELNIDLYVKISNRFKELRRTFILSFKAVGEGSGITGATVKKIEEGKGTVYIDSIASIISFYGIEYQDFFNFSKPLPPKEVLRRNMIRFHKKYNSLAYQIIEKKPDLIDLIELKLIETSLFDSWIMDKDVYNYCKDHYNYKYLLSSIPNTLNLAITKGWLIMETGSSPKRYMKSPSFL